MRVETRQPIQSAGGVASARKPEGGAAFSLGATPSS
ncbi:flagellar assembly protein fliX, partial [Methylobacterium radiotolerans]